jgi:hypothetical protein
VALSADERVAIAASKEAAARGEFATDEYDCGEKRQTGNFP